MATAPREIPDPTINLLLGSLTDRSLLGLRPGLTSVQLKLGDVLYQENAHQSYVYFPTAGVVSLVYLMADGSTAEVALVGRNGLVGFPTIFGDSQTTGRSVVQVSGHAYRMHTREAKKLSGTDSNFQSVLLKYAQAMVTLMAQTGICNRHHTVSQQLCRWILHSIDLVDSDTIQMTQQLIADMLGLRREGVSAVAGELKRAGIIDYKRGQIAVLDRRAMEREVCECYAVVVNETRRILPRTRRHGGTGLPNKARGI